VARPAAAAVSDVQSFCTGNASWVVEDCYADLIRAALAFAPALVFLDPQRGAVPCQLPIPRLAAAQVPSKAAQDERLPFRLTWVRAYYARTGELSHAGHVATYDAYRGPKHRLTQPPLLDPPSAEVLALLD
jgi:hypothetical protein